MPANEQIWRSPKLMHAVFGVTALLMLVSTIWMMAKDHAREWKDYQRTTLAINQFFQRGQFAELESAEYRKTVADAEAALLVAQTELPDKESLEAFKQAVKDDAQRREVDPIDLAQFDAHYEQLTPLVQAARAAREEAENAREQASRSIDIARKAAAEGVENADAVQENATELALQAKQKHEDALEANQAAIETRNALIKELADVVVRAKFREDNLLKERKFALADQTATLSLRDIAVGQGHTDDVERLQAEADAHKERIDDLTTRYQAASIHRKRLEDILKGDDGIQTAELEAQKALTDAQAELARIEQGIEGLWEETGRTVLGLPVLDAFDTSDTQIDQLWLPDLTINYNFSSVARFDRCITCHRSIRKAAPGSGGVGPAYEHEHRLTVTLSTPDSPPPPVFNEQTAEWLEPTLDDIYGMDLAEEGLLDPNDATIKYVRPETLAVMAGLEMGDVIEAVDGAPVLERQQAVGLLLGDAVEWGQPLTLSIRRGLPHPYVTHPRLDLYLTDASPHPMGTMGCTVCHDGQGSATEFKWASHTPNNPEQADRWRREHGWFDNHHWIFPMTSQRFLESNCLKCHHQVTELEPSERYPKPPAEKLVRGYNLVREYGCFGCHEVNGYDGPDRRIGPDLRAEPNFFAAAHSLMDLKGLSDQEREWAETLTRQPENTHARRRLFEVFESDKKLADDIKSENQPRFTADAYKLAASLKDVETPGSFRKVGPSLRFLESKVDFDFLYDWVRDPRDFRPSTRMPQFFGLHEHLAPSEAHHTEMLEAVEIRAISQYLLDASKKFEYLPRQSGVTEKPSIARGKKLFQTRGCLACHQMDDFPEVTADQGPDLSRIASKLDTAKGEKWLYSWILQPSHYHFRTKMPDLFLEPIDHGDGKISDPAADISAYLLSTGVGLQVAVEEEKPTVSAVTSGSAAAKAGLQVGDVVLAIGQGADGEMVDVVGKTDDEIMALLRGRPLSQMRIKFSREQEPTDDAGADDAADGEPATEEKNVTLRRDGWKPTDVPVAAMSSEEEQALYDLSLGYIEQQFPRSKAEEYLVNGIPESEAKSVKGDEVVFVGMDAKDHIEKQLEYLGRRTIGKYGCAGCHDIPGFEDAKPIGTALAEWGRKEPSKLAFEQIALFLDAHGEHEDDGEHAEAHDDEHHAPRSGLTEADRRDPDTAYFLDALAAHNRQGFLWQKLRQPRSYDFMKVENKGYHERLRMPKFPFDAEEREAVMTFVLGLVAEPPASKYIYQPGPRQEAIVEGRRVLDRYNCAGCHVMEMERWEFDYHEKDFRKASDKEDFPFLDVHFTPDQIADSLETNRRGMRQATVIGRPAMNEETGAPLLFNEEKDSITPEEAKTAEQVFTSFQLWKPTLINGEKRLVGSANLLIREKGTKKYPAWGGALADYLYPVVIADEKKINPAVKGSEAWGWLPPPLIGEGLKVQTPWLHDFLLEPYRIRPAVVMRMPKFNMSSDEATKLANYFAAVDNATYPYDYDPRTGRGRLDQASADHPNRMDDALKIVTNSNYCVKCHLVGDFMPEGSEKVMGPNLAEVHSRLRPDYMRDWIANPVRILPYTGMPVNIEYKDVPPHFGGVSQELFPGTSIEQLDGVVDLLLTYPQYTEQQFSVRNMVKPADDAPTDEPNTDSPTTSTSESP